ncbi:MAG: GntR family transcriptional regulator [Pseudonocardiaceae bacterium]
MAQAPRYREVADDIREAILREQALVNVLLTDGAQLPTEPEFGAYFQVSRGTIREALRELAAEGLIETRGRSGTYVRRLPMLEYNADAENPHRRDDEPGLADTWFSVVKRSGRTPGQDFRFRIEPAATSVASRLHIEVNDLVVVRECARQVDEIPWSEQVSYYPYPIAEKCGLNTPHDIPEGTVRRMATQGVIEERLDHEISSRPANEEERRKFGLASGVSVLIYRRVGWSNDRPIRYTLEILPADRNVITHVTNNPDRALET